MPAFEFPIRLTLDSSNPQIPAAVFTGVNVQIVNGAGLTQSRNSTGNLIIGYNEADDSPLHVCTDEFTASTAWSRLIKGVARIRRGRGISDKARATW